jgi:hypothetical protein
VYFTSSQHFNSKLVPGPNCSIDCQISFIVFFFIFFGIVTFSSYLDFLWTFYLEFSSNEEFKFILAIRDAHAFAVTIPATPQPPTPQLCSKSTTRKQLANINEKMSSSAE